MEGVPCVRVKPFFLGVCVGGGGGGGGGPEGGGLCGGRRSASLTCYSELEFLNVQWHKCSMIEMFSIFPALKSVLINW